MSINLVRSAGSSSSPKTSAAIWRGTFYRTRLNQSTLSRLVPTCASNIKIVGYKKYNNYVIKALVASFIRPRCHGLDGSWLFEDLIHWSRISFIIFHVWGVAVTKATVQSSKIQNLILFAWNFFLWLWGIIYSWLIIKNLLVLHNYRIYTIMCFVSVFLLYIFGYVQLTFEQLNYWTVSLSDRMSITKYNLMKSD